MKTTRTIVAITLLTAGAISCVGAVDASKRFPTRPTGALLRQVEVRPANPPPAAPWSFLVRGSPCEEITDQ